MVAVALRRGALIEMVTVSLFQQAVLVALRRGALIEMISWYTGVIGMFGRTP